MKTCCLLSPRIAVLCGYLDSYACLGSYTVEVNKRDYCNRHGYTLLCPRSVPPEWLDPQSHATGFSWFRLDYLRKALASGEYDWIWTVGADTMITNMAQPLEPIIASALTAEAERLPLPRKPTQFAAYVPTPLISWTPPRGHQWTGRKHLLICGEAMAPIQADSFIMRASPESIAYLSDILDQWPLYKHHTWVENQTMIDLRDKHAAITCIIPQWMMNSYDYRRFYAMHPVYRTGKDCYGNRGQWQPGDFLIHWAGASMAQRMEYLEFYKTQIRQ